MLTSTLAAIAGAGAGLAERAVAVAGAAVACPARLLAPLFAGGMRSGGMHTSSHDLGEPVWRGNGDGRTSGRSRSAPGRSPEPPSRDDDVRVAPGTAHFVAERALRDAERRDAPEVRERPPEDLPVPGWDELTVAAIRQRLRSLPQEDLTALLAYERAHGDRQPVVLALENRLARLVAAPPT